MFASTALPMCVRVRVHIRRTLARLGTLTRLPLYSLSSSARNCTQTTTNNTHIGVRTDSERVMEDLPMTDGHRVREAQRGPRKRVARRRETEKEGEWLRVTQTKGDRDGEK